MVENESGLISAVPPISLMDSCRLQLAPGKLADGTRAQPIMVLLQSTGKYPASRLYYGTTTEIDRLPEGNLRVDLIFRDTTRCSATIRLRKGGINYLRMDSLVDRRNRHRDCHGYGREIHPLGHGTGNARRQLYRLPEFRHQTDLRLRL